MRKAKILPIAIIALAIVAFIFMVDYSISDGKWPWSAEKTVTTKATNTNTTITNDEPQVGGDADEHGCIGSAGYSWCEVKQKCLRTWEEGCTVTDANSNAGTSIDVTEGWESFFDLNSYSIKYPSDYKRSRTLSGYSFQKINPASDSTYRVDITMYGSPIEGSKPGQDVWTWANNGFPKDTNVEKYHPNLRQIRLGDNTFWVYDGVLAGKPVLEYLMFYKNSYSQKSLFVLTDFRDGDTAVDTNTAIISTFRPMDPISDPLPPLQ